MTSDTLENKFVEQGDLTAQSPCVETEQDSRFEMSTSPEDPTSMQWLRLAEASGAASSWDHPDEDIYTDEDGTPL